jgi:hypothetical protein
MLQPLCFQQVPVSGNCCIGMELYGLRKEGIMKIAGKLL